MVALIIAKRYGVAYQSQYRRPPVEASDFPDLRSSSDIAWLAWKPYHDKGIKLNHVFTWSITNGGTQRLIAAALEATLMDKDLKSHPWVGWSADEGPGSLVLGQFGRYIHKNCKANCQAGSPNGLGIGYLLGKSDLTIRYTRRTYLPLAQHKPELGNRRVRAFEVFLADTAASNVHEPTVYWSIEDSPKEWTDIMEK